MKFECSSCGLCCKNLRKALTATTHPKWLQDIVDVFPHKTNSDGSCEKLIDNHCSVYKDRPLLCNVERIHDEAETNMTEDTWYRLNTQACKQLQLEIL